MPMHQFDHLMAFGTIFAGLDAWNIGANDVANSWATSVASRSVTYIQAMSLGSVLEFAGSVGVGARVADTIRSKILDTNRFSNNPAMLMLVMTCAVTASSLYLTVCTRFGLPVSTTHSIMGGLIGAGVAATGSQGIFWVTQGGGTAIISGGVIQVFLAWIIAPGLSGIFAAIIFLVTKYGVMLRSNPVWKAFALVPVYFGITAGLIVMLLAWKGGNIAIPQSDAELIGIIIGSGAAFALLICVTLMPWLYRVVIKEDWQLRWYHIPMGLLLLRRGEVPPPPNSHAGLQNFYAGHLTAEELAAKRAAEGTDAENSGVVTDAEGKVVPTQGKGINSSNNSDVDSTEAGKPKLMVGPKPEGSNFSGPVLFWWVKWALFRGVDQDVVGMQKKKDFLSGDLEKVHAHASHFDNKAEFMYSFLQVMTASAASFVHGANDVANAIGPYATIFQIWESGALPPKDKAEVPIWILVYGGAMISIGIWTYGYNIMRNLGNKITLHSPSRGFSMELGSVVTVIMATRLKLPISTTQCITGATVGVGLCAGTWRTINWRMVAWIYMGWIITLPTAGLISGFLMAIIMHSPKW